MKIQVVLALGLLASCTAAKPQRVRAEVLPEILSSLGYDTHSLWFHGGDECYWYLSQPQVVEGKVINRNYRGRADQIQISAALDNGFCGWKQGVHKPRKSGEDYERCLDESLPQAIHSIDASAHGFAGTGFRFAHGNRFVLSSGVPVICPMSSLASLIFSDLCNSVLILDAPHRILGDRGVREEGVRE